MAEQGDLDELARRYLDLWQDQMTALANDPEMAEATEQMLRLMGFAPPDGETSAHAGTGNGNPWANAHAWQQAMQANALAGTQAAGQQASAAWGWPMAMMTALAQGAQQAPGGWPGAGGMPPGWPPQAWGAPGYPGGSPQGPGAGWPGAGWTPPHPGAQAGPYGGWGPPAGYGPPPGWSHPSQGHPGWSPPHGGTAEPTSAGQAGTPGAQGSADERQGDRGDVTEPDQRAQRAGAGAERSDANRQPGPGAGGSNSAARPATGTASPARASGRGDLDVDDLAGRLTRLEERLAALEGPGGAKPGGPDQQPGGKAGKSPPRNRKRGS